MKKALTGSIVAVAFAVGLVAIPNESEAQVRPSPTPILKIVPGFSCAITPNGTTGTVTITKTNAATVDKTYDVVAIVQTPSGKVSTAVCGSQFTSTAVGTKVTAPVSLPASTDKSFIYTCTASQTQTTSACNPPK